MKVKVVIPFKDKDTGKVNNTGATLDCTSERYSQIRKYVAVVKEDEVKEDKPAKKADK